MEGRRTPIDRSQSRYIINQHVLPIQFQLHKVLKFVPLVSFLATTSMSAVLDESSLGDPSAAEVLEGFLKFTDQFGKSPF
jgi:hypothetical protein